MATAHPNITLGTAGHIDHGKTALIRFLTGCETDRLKIEKERGMSIDLGFAPCTIGGRIVGIVDVPGHENFVKTMVAGACGMDGVILVVAADDGVMPQTREHLEIVTLLGVRHGVVALTKVDRVPPDRVEQVTGDLQRFVRGTFLEGAPIIPMCNLTGEGFEAFYRALDELVSSITPKRTDGAFRLPVDRAFSARGYGTIVSGIPVSGSIGVGEEIVLLPQGDRGEVRGIEVYGDEAPRAMAGQCAALNVRRLDHRTIGRGDALAAPGYFTATEWFAVRIELLPHAGLALDTGARVVFHTGTSEAGATVYLIEGDRLAAGQSGLAQVHVQKPLVAAPADRFILRLPAPLRTVGGGTVVEPIPRRLKRSRADVRRDLRERADAVGDAASFVEYGIRTAEGGVAGPFDLSVRAKLPPARLKEVLDGLLAAGRVKEVKPGLYAHCRTLREAADGIVQAMRDHYAASPQSVGLPAEEVGKALGLASELFEGALALLRSEGKLVEVAGRLALPDHSVDFSAQDRALLDRVEAEFKKDEFHPPDPGAVADAVGVPPQKAEWGLRVLREHGALVEVGPLLFHREAVDHARDILESFLRKEGRLESVKFKYLLDTTRKYAIPLLDYFDRVGATRRVGNTRFPRNRA